MELRDRESISVRLDSGVVVMPIDEYDDLVHQMKMMIEKINELQDENESLRSLYASLRLPMADSIEQDTIETDEYTNPANFKKQRIIRFTYTS